MQNIPDLRPDLPVTASVLTAENRADYLAAFKELGCRRLWIAPYPERPFERCDLSALGEHVAFFKARGVETGIWINAFGFGGRLKDPPGFQTIVTVTGVCRPDRDEMCPADPGFTAAMADYISRLAALSPDLIMLDDDLCTSVRPGIGCFCPRHLKMMSEKLGEPLSLTPDLPQKLFAGGGNRYRDAWYAATGDGMREFCRRMRRAVDEVDPAVRLGFCAGYTSWTFEGADPVELSAILAGNTRPFFRFTSAPYWVAPSKRRFPSMRLNAVVENARMQAAWCRGTDAEVFAENDSYPRPAYHVDASYMELFDAGMRACGVRSLKYMLDYTSPLGYEQSYMRAHLENAALLERAGAAFADKTPLGVRLHCKNRNVTARVLPEKFTAEKNAMYCFFSLSAAFLTGLGVPVSYDGDPAVSAAFGDEALNMELDGVKKLILDLPAARFLAQRGADTGIRGLSPAPTPEKEIAGGCPAALYFVGKDAPADGGFFAVEPKDGARVISEFEADGARFPAAYIYESDGREYLVFCFDAASAGEQSTLFLSYLRANQLRALTPFCPYAPETHGIYQIYAGKGSSRALLVENLSDDRFSGFTVRLPERARSLRITGADGTLADGGKTLRLTAPFYPKQMIVAEYETL